MAQIKFYKTTSPKLNDIAVENGNLIFCEDTRTIYLDNASERVAYLQIMLLPNDETRIIMTPNLVSGFYFVLSNNILWRLDGSTWIQITEKPSELIVYGTLSTFPRPGRQGTLYMTDTKLYHWSDDDYAYVNYCDANPRWIVEN